MSTELPEEDKIFFDHSEIEKDYRSGLDELYRGLREFKKNPATFEFGPQYSVMDYSDGAGQVPEIKVLEVRYKNGYNEEVSLLASDENGKLLGHRNYRLTQEGDVDGTEHIAARGYYHSGYKGKKLAVAMELVNQDMLQRLADAKGPVKWVVNNQNGFDLNEREQMLLRYPDDQNLKEEVAAKREEQKAWQRIWGIGGLAGVEQGFPHFLGQKYFLPKTSDRINNPGEITITRDKGSNNLTSIIQEGLETSSENKDQELEQKRKRLGSLISQIEQIIRK